MPEKSTEPEIMLPLA